MMEAMTWEERAPDPARGWGLTKAAGVRKGSQAGTAAWAKAQRTGTHCDVAMRLEHRFEGV